MSFQFSEKVAVVTGGCSGIGRAIALALVQAGAHIVIADIKDGSKTLDLLRAHGGEATYVQTDVTQAKQIRALIRTVLKTYGRLDFGINNAGTYKHAALTHKWTESAWDKMVTLNLKGVWLCMKYEIPPMLEQEAGVIVNIASVAGLVGIERKSAYVASKHGVVGLTKAAALDYAQHGIRINAVCPGSVSRPTVRNTEMFTEHRRDDGRHPIGRFCTVEEVADAVLWLCSDTASFVTGHALAVDGGWTAR